MMRSWRAGVTGVLTTIGFLCLGNNVAPAQTADGKAATLGSPAGEAREPSRLVLRNTRFDSVRVELRAGPAEDCENSRVLAVRSVPRGRAWGITTDQPICWRRVEDPTRATSAWGPWNRRSLAPGARATESL
jgi:hypothetical protein